MEIVKEVAEVLAKMCSRHGSSEALRLAAEGANKTLMRFANNCLTLGLWMAINDKPLVFKLDEFFHPGRNQVHWSCNKITFRTPADKQNGAAIRIAQHIYPTLVLAEQPDLVVALGEAVL